MARLLLHDLPPVAEVLIVHQLTIDLAETITRFERVILIDAMASVPPGEMCIVDVVPQDGTPEMSHYVTPAALLLAADVLYDHVPDTVLVGIGADQFDGESLTAPVGGAVPEAARLIREMLATT